MEKQVVLTLTLRVVYDPNGMTAAELKALLDDHTRRAIGNGMLSGDTPAEVDEYSMQIVEG